MGLLDGKGALITGASRGIGKAIALRFAAEGADIAFTDLKVIPETVAELEATGMHISKKLLMKSVLISWWIWLTSLV